MKKSIEDMTYQFEVVTPNNKYYNRLVELQKEYPKLTYQNRGYDTIPHDIWDAHKEQVDEITEILSDSLLGFQKFQNFKLRDNGDIVIRLKYFWDTRFVGVGYFNIGFWNEEEHQKCVESVKELC